jgi:membrane-bound serine protease (ClpP class)
MDNLTLAYVLIGIGVLLMAAELLIPTGGILLAASCIVILAGVAMTFYFGDPFTGMVTLVITLVGVPILATGFLYLWPWTPLGRKLIQAGDRESDTLASMPAFQELEQLRGRYGRTVSSMRPSGVVDFDGKRVDAMTEGGMLDPNAWVRCIDVRPGGRVIVRAVEKPDLGDMDSTDFR